MKSFKLALALWSLEALPSLAQTVLREQIWGSVIYTRYGDRTPYVLPTPDTLTPLGARQMYSAGDRFKDRYLTPTGGDGHTVIQNISPVQLQHDQVRILSLNQQFVAASAQAFMQGLYPPLQTSSNATFIVRQSTLANGSNILSPLDGYQYPQMDTTSFLDLDSVWLAGADHCPLFDDFQNRYFTSAAYGDVRAKSQTFYESLQSGVLDGVITSSMLTYGNAYLIYDYLNYGFVHNSSLAKDLSTSDLSQAKTLADEWAWAIFGNTSSSEQDQIRAIAGRTLAFAIMKAINGNIQTSGSLNKMTLLFGGFEPMISFAALAGLASEQNPQFRKIPDYGSSMVFELYSLSENDSSTYPSVTDLNIRFFFQEGINNDNGSDFVAYPLFGNGPSGISMTLTDFTKAMGKFMIQGGGEWCRVCASYSIFCPAFEGNESDQSPSRSRPSSRTGLSPVVAGVVGAIVALALVGIIVAAAMLLGGLRLYRRRTKKRSELNGFKGGEKLASDQDLTLPKTAAGASVASADDPPANSHERVGSWELGDQKRTEGAALPRLGAEGGSLGRPSSEVDDFRVNPFADPVKPNDHV
jgi:hypothetical protein